LLLEIKRNILFEKEYQAFDTVSLLGIASGDETLRLMLDISREV